MPMELDHLVLGASDVERTVGFYSRDFGAEVRDLDEWRAGVAEYQVLHFGTWKINVHPSAGAGATAGPPGMAVGAASGTQEK